MAGEAEHQEPRRPGEARDGDQDEDGGDGNLDDEHAPPTIRHGEPDVDGWDKDEHERIDSRWRKPPKEERRRGRYDTNRDSPNEGRWERRARPHHSWARRRPGFGITCRDRP